MLWDEPKIFFLERRYFFSIILSEFLKNRVALQIEIRISPNMEEQKKIAAYFSQLDALIYQLEQELAKLQSIKKALLEKMFV